MAYFLHLKVLFYTHFSLRGFDLMSYIPLDLYLHLFLVGIWPGDLLGATSLKFPYMQWVVFGDAVLAPPAFCVFLISFSWGTLVF